MWRKLLAAKGSGSTPLDMVSTARSHLRRQRNIRGGSASRIKGGAKTKTVNRKKKRGPVKKPPSNSRKRIKSNPKRKSQLSKRKTQSSKRKTPQSKKNKSSIKRKLNSSKKKSRPPLCHQEVFFSKN